MPDVEQARDIDAQAAGDLREAHEAGVALAPFDGAEVGRMQVGLLAERLEREVAGPA
tara:strand:- start:437 stop:607 length:171 start_codon:yes stop_codon:yes gene_type:complete